MTNRIRFFLLHVRFSLSFTLSHSISLSPFLSLSLSHTLSLSFSLSLSRFSPSLSLSLFLPLSVSVPPSLSLCLSLSLSLFLSCSLSFSLFLSLYSLSVSPSLPVSLSLFHTKASPYGAAEHNESTAHKLTPCELIDTSLTNSHVCHDAHELTPPANSYTTLARTRTYAMTKRQTQQRHKLMHKLIQNSLTNSYVCHDEKAEYQRMHSHANSAFKFSRTHTCAMTPLHRRQQTASSCATYPC